MPYETVQEKVVQERRIQVCARCRRPLGGGDDATNNRHKARQAGSIGGSLGASLGGSIALGAVLGPVGAIGGAIAGSLVGGKAGVQASDKICDALEANQNELCAACQKLSSREQGGGQRLGGGASWMGRSTSQQPSSATRSSWTDNSTGSSGQRLGSGEPIPNNNNNNNNPLDAAGRGLQNGLSWMKQSVTNVIDNAKQNLGEARGNNSNNNNNNNSPNNNNNSNSPPSSTSSGGTGPQTSGIL